MHGVEYVEEVFQLRLSFLTVVEEKKGECKQGGELKHGKRMRCN